MRSPGALSAETFSAVVASDVIGYAHMPTTNSSVLDFMRAVAVCLVLLDHFLEAYRSTSLWWMSQRLAWIGVMLFFVHTSLVLMFSLERTRAAGAALVKHFYIRRLFRIYPLSIAILLVILAFQISVAAWPWQSTPLSVSTVVSNLLLIQNLTYAPSILGPLWTLPLELQMYVILPFVFLMLRKDFRIETAVLLWGASVLLAFVQPHITGRASVFQYAPCFMGGVIAFCCSKDRRPSLPFWAWVIALVASIVVFLNFTATVDSERLMHASWILGLVIGFVLPSFTETTSSVVRTASATVAKYSYSIYLTHMVAFWVAFSKLQNTDPATRVVVGAVLVVGLPLAAYHLIEVPGINFGTRVAKRFLAPTELMANSPAA